MHQTFMQQQPIGIFDSGIGGLTVARAIKQLCPNESLIYFGDTAHLPYGDKSPESIRQYSVRITEFLLEQNCKSVVIACNTASSLAWSQVKEVAQRTQVFDVVRPVVKHIASHFQGKTVGIIGTKGTINSRIYSKRIRKEEPGIQVKSMATPLLASMIEEGFFDNKISNTIINAYLGSRYLSGIDAIVLACTHYPLIKKEVDAFYSGQVAILDNAEIVASKVHQYLTENNLLNTNKNTSDQFYVSDYTKSFEKSTKLFFGDNIKLQEVRLWE